MSRVPVVAGQGLDSEDLLRKTSPRLTFEIISHSDAGKATLTGKLLLDSYGHAAGLFNTAAPRGGSDSFR